MTTIDELATAALLTLTGERQRQFAEELSGAIKPSCPVCGGSVEHVRDGQTWACARCGEHDARCVMQRRAETLRHKYPEIAGAL